MPQYQKLMIFVDGTNFLIELFKEIGLRNFRSDRADKLTLTGIEVASVMIRHLLHFKIPNSKFLTIIRRWWFGSYKKGNEQDKIALRNTLRQVGFEPALFEKINEKEKGVDIALTKEMLINAFNQNYDVGLLISGDGDYTDVVNEVKRYGPIIIGSFFLHGLSDYLRYAFDNFIPIDKSILRNELNWAEPRMIEAEKEIPKS
jgi:uncharacterized LabA/DUF88 family protein